MDKDEKLRIMSRLLNLLGTGETGQKRTYSAEDWWILEKIAYLTATRISPDGEIEVL